MNNEKNSIYQEYSQIQEKNQWMVIYQVLTILLYSIQVFLRNHLIIIHDYLITECERCKRSWGEKLQLHDKWVKKDTQ